MSTSSAIVWVFFTAGLLCENNGFVMSSGLFYAASGWIVGTSLGGRANA